MNFLFDRYVEWSWKHDGRDYEVIWLEADTKNETIANCYICISPLYFTAYICYHYIDN